MPQKAKTYGDAFYAKLVACSQSPIPTVSGERYRVAYEKDGKLKVAMNIDKPSTPIGAECVVQPVTIGKDTFYNVL